MVTCAKIGSRCSTCFETLQSQMHLTYRQMRYVSCFSSYNREKLRLNKAPSAKLAMGRDFGPLAQENYASKFAQRLENTPCC